ncbi:uncharacterized protein RAG0_01176 [Rhynchosporium agropyri]|uniref:Uncharacterized protein n=1 Tax=Rhynchosporium agropyri TaxID=914238 RepID=A0A1E1JWL6_9HELO|nr:uncharacterized protein RAG0_01176 [Rhynchosporium agropyri]
MDVHIWAEQVGLDLDWRKRIIERKFIEKFEEGGGCEGIAGGKDVWGNNLGNCITRPCPQYIDRLEGKLQELQTVQINDLETLKCSEKYDTSFCGSQESLAAMKPPGFGMFELLLPTTKVATGSDFRGT